jgi:hypothetical protein
MEYEETYKGRKIRIVTAQAANGTWRSTAALVDGPGQTLASDAHASEQEARRAALSTAMAEVDRSRAHIGKP